MVGGVIYKRSVMSQAKSQEKKNSWHNSRGEVCGIMSDPEKNTEKTD